MRSKKPRKNVWCLEPHLKSFTQYRMPNVTACNLNKLLAYFSSFMQDFYLYSEIESVCTCSLQHTLTVCIRPYEKQPILNSGNDGLKSKDRFTRTSKHGYMNLQKWYTENASSHCNSSNTLVTFLTCPPPSPHQLFQQSVSWSYPHVPILTIPELQNLFMFLHEW